MSPACLQSQRDALSNSRCSFNLEPSSLADGCLPPRPSRPPHVIQKAINAAKKYQAQTTRQQRTEKLAHASALTPTLTSYLNSSAEIHQGLAQAGLRMLIRLTRLKQRQLQLQNRRSLVQHWSGFDDEVDSVKLKHTATLGMVCCPMSKSC